MKEFALNAIISKIWLFMMSCFATHGAFLKQKMPLLVLFKTVVMTPHKREVFTSHNLMVIRNSTRELWSLKKIHKNKNSSLVLQACNICQMTEVNKTINVFQELLRAIKEL